MNVIERHNVWHWIVIFQTYANMKIKSINTSCCAVDESAPSLIRGRRFNPEYGENSIESAVTLMGPAMHDLISLGPNTDTKHRMDN